MFNLIEKLINYKLSTPSTLAAVSKIEITSHLKQIGEEILKKLEKANNYKERKGIARKATIQILDGFPFSGTVAWKQVAFLQEPTLIKETSIDGGSLGDSIAYWIQLFLTFKNFFKNKQTLLKTKLEEIQIIQLIGVLEDFSNFDIRFENPEGILLKIKAELNVKKFIHIPIGYRPVGVSKGHAIVLRLEQEEDYILATLENLGDGSEDYPILDYSTTQDLVSYRSYYFKIGKSEFYGGIGVALFSTLRGYLEEPPPPHCKPYCGQDILDIFCAIFEMDPTLGLDIERLKATSQTSGYCAESSVQLVIRDFFIKENFSLLEMQMEILHIKLISLMHAYNMHMKNPTRDSTHILRISAETFGVAYKEIESQYSMSEKVIINEIIHQICKCTKTKREKSDVSFQVQGLKHPLLIDLPELPAVKEFGKNFSALPFENLELIVPNHALPPVNKYSLPKLGLTPKCFLQSLKSWIEYIHQIPVDEQFPFFFACTQSLPIPKWGIDQWDLVPVEQIKEIVPDLKKFVIKGLNHSKVLSDERKSAFSEQFLSIYTIYTVVDKLVRRNAKALNGFASPFYIDYLEAYPKEFISLPMGEDNQRYFAIKTYFTHAKKESNDSVIFPIEKVLSTHKYLQQAAKNWRTPGASHILFLEALRDNKNKFERDFIHVWKDLKNISNELYTLYYFAFLSYVILSKQEYCSSMSNSEIIPYPEELLFKETSDKEGHRALAIQVQHEEKIFHHEFALEKKEIGEITLPLFDFFEQTMNRNNSSQRLESRFSNFSIFVSRNSIPFYLSDYNQMSSKQIVCYHLNKNKNDFRLSEGVFRELLLMTHQNHLKLGNALTWMKTNLMHLSHTSVQWTLQHCLFGPYGVQERLSQEPGLIEDLRKVVSEGLKYCNKNPNHYRTILFLIMTGIGIESHGFVVMGIKGSELPLAYYEENLETLLINCSQQSEKIETLETVLLFLRLHQNPNTQKNAHEILIQVFAEKDRPYYSDYSWIKEKLILLSRPYSKQINFTPEVRNQFCNKLLFTLFKKEVNYNWSGNYPHFFADTYHIDLFNMTVSSDPGKLISFKDYFKSKIIKELIHKEGNLGWKRDVEDLERHESLNGNLVIYRKEHRTIVERKLKIAGEERWYTCHQFTNFADIDKARMAFVYSYKLDFIHYIPKEKRAEDPDYYVFDRSKDIPVMSAIYKDKESHFTKTDSEGYLLPIVLVNLSAITDKNHVLYKYVNRFSQSEYVLFFCNKNTAQVEELNFFYMNLQFKRDEFGLQSETFKDYYFLPEKTLESLYHFEGALVLQNRLNGQFKVIIPVTSLKSDGIDFSTKVFVNEAYTLREAEIVYQIYDVEPQDGSLISKSSSGYLFLAYLFQNYRDYEKANFYLMKTKGHRVASIDSFVFKQMQEFIDYSPSGLSFKMKFVLVILENKNKMGEARFKNPDYGPDLFQWMSKTYLEYLTAVHSERKYFEGGEPSTQAVKSIEELESLSVIPKDLRLTLSQEKLVIYSLKEFYDRKAVEQINYPEKDKLKIHPLIEIRYQYFSFPSSKTKVTISPLFVSSTPHIFVNRLREPNHLRKIPEDEFRAKDDHKPSHPVSLKSLLLKYFNLRKVDENEDLSFKPFPHRLTTITVIENFSILFERAKKEQGKAEFKLLLLACFNSFERDLDFHRDLVSILFYVYSCPTFFSKISFEALTSEEDKVIAFNKVIGIIEENKEFRILYNELRGKNRLFDYSIERHLQLTNGRSQPLPFPETPSVSWIKQPFLRFFELIFIKKETPLNIPEEPTFLGPKEADETDSIKGSIQKNFRLGYEALKKKQRTHYQQISKDLEKVKIEIKEYKKSLQIELEKRRRQILLMANHPFKMSKGQLSAKEIEDEINFRFDSKTHQVLTLTPENIMKESILRNDEGWIKKHRSQIDNETLIRLSTEVKEYYHQKVLCLVAEEAQLKLLKMEENGDDPFLPQQLAQLLEYKFLYDPLLYPEISYFKVMAGKLPRESQFLTYEWVCEGLEKKENRLFQLPAGDGKTSYLEPLMALRVLRYKKLPVIVTTQAIYTVDKGNLGKIFQSLEILMGILEVGMHMKLSSDQAKFIYEQLRFYQAQGQVLLITPQIYAALHLLHYFAGLKELDSEKVHWLGLVSKFFEKEGVLIGDESHCNLDSLIRAIFGVGDLNSLPKEECQLLFELLKPLVGFEMIYDDAGKEIPNLSILAANSQGGFSAAEITHFQKILATHIAKSPRLSIPDEQKMAFINYWTNKNSPQPQLLLEWKDKDKRRANLASIVSYFILNLFSEVVTLRTGFDHGPSIYPEQEFHTPWYHGSPSTAQYKDPLRAIVFTAQDISYEGIKRTQLQSLISAMVKTDWEEKSLEQKDSSTSLLFQKWLEGTKFEGLHLKDIDFSDNKLMNELTKVLAKNKWVIEYYLINVVFPQIVYSSEQIVSTPAHLFKGLSQSVIFSATPLFPVTAYPEEIHTIKYDECFEAHVAMELSKPHHERVMVVKGVDDFFSKLKADGGSVGIDVGGFFCDFKNQEVAKRWREHSNAKGVVYFKEGQSLSVDRDEKICVDLNDRQIECEGSNLEKVLEEQKIDWEQEEIHLFFDSPHTESTHLPSKQTKVEMVYLFLGASTTSQRLIQAVKRRRNFGDGTDSVHIIWVLHEDLAKKIAPSGAQELNIKTFFDLCITNFAAEMKKRVIMTAFQQVAYHVALPAKKEIDEQVQNGEKQMKVMEKYRKGILESCEHDPYKHFSMHEEETDIKVVLKTYAQELYAKFNYEKSYEDNKAVKDAVKKIIDTARQSVKKISAQFNEQISEQVEQQTRLKKDEEQEEHKPRASDRISGRPRYGNVSIDDPDFLEKAHICNANRYFSIPLSQNFFFEINQIDTAIEGGVSLYEKYLKPINYLTIVLYKTKTGQKSAAAIAILDEINEAYIKKMMECSSQKLMHKAFMITATGSIYQRGKKGLQPDPKEVEEIMRSEWMRDLVIDVALLKGQITDYRRLVERIKNTWTWPKFEEFWEKTVKALPNPERANQTAFNQLKLLVDKK